MSPADLPPASDPSQLPDTGTAPQGPVLNEKAPSVVALRILQQLVIDARRDAQFRTYADTDLRMMNDLEASFTKNPKDPSAMQWLRQLSLSWNTKLRGNPPLRFRRLLDLVETARR